METRKAELTLDEIKTHNSKEDCWIAVHSKVWNVTEFLEEHPGGAASKLRFILENRKLIQIIVILKYAGADATQAYEDIHAPGIIEESLPEENYMGELLPPNSPSPNVAPEATPAAEIAKPVLNSAVQAVQTFQKPELETLISATDFEQLAEKTFSPKAWAFYSSAATDLVTHRANKSLLRRLMWRPRILRDVTHVSMKRSMLGFESDAPFFISPAAMARLAHKDGELALAKGAASENIIQCVRPIARLASRTRAFADRT